MDRGAWRTTVHEVAEWTQLKRLNNNWYICILHKGERGKKKTMRKEDNFSFVQKEDSKTFLFKIGIRFFKGKIRSYFHRKPHILIKGKIPAYKPQGGATIPCLQILNF